MHIIRNQFGRCNIAIAGWLPAVNDWSEAEVVFQVKDERARITVANLKVQGIQGHVAYPQWTLNPIDGLTKILNTIINTILDEGTKDFPPSNVEIVKIYSARRK